MQQALPQHPCAQTQKQNNPGLHPYTQTLTPLAELILTPLAQVLSNTLIFYCQSLPTEEEQQAFLHITSNLLINNEGYLLFLINEYCKLEKNKGLSLQQDVFDALRNNNSSLLIFTKNLHFENLCIRSIRMVFRSLSLDPNVRFTQEEEKLLVLKIQDLIKNETSNLWIMTKVEEYKIHSDNAAIILSYQLYKTYFKAFINKDQI